ncbi:MAG: DUF5329 domain-containing protein [Burkholderiaceae bacterium]|jgi:hypothetical protein|nr:DUF5329 domain-containing protein [Burkholderiaceae bacterium]
MWNQRRKSACKNWLALFALLSCFFVCAQAWAMSEEEKIVALIESVRSTPEGTQFVRNGTAYDVADAVSHLSMKYSKAKSRVKTAEDFIRYVASGSSISGQPYLIRYPDGTAVTAAAFFTERLRKLSEEKGP